MLNEQIKEKAIQRIRTDRFNYGTGYRLGYHFVLITLTIPQKDEDLCRSHHLPSIFQIGSKIGCKICLEISRNQSMFLQEELLKAA